jgi:FG-GAP repeat
MVDMRRVLITAASLILVAGVVLTAPADAGRASAAQPTAARSVQADFNHDGTDDLAVGAPFEDVGRSGDAGAVNVLYGGAGGLAGTGSQLFTQVGGMIEARDHFGAALTTGDFNHDGYADLAAGAPGEAVGSLAAAGAVSVLYGSAAGLTAAGGRLFTQVGGTVEGGDSFGSALTAGDFNHDGYADLAVGAPGETVGSLASAGAVSILYGSTGGLTAASGRLFTQVGGTVEGGDEFGFALAAGDFNHDNLADLAAGAPSEDVGSARDAGAVSVLYGSASGLTTSGGRMFTQVGGAVEFDDKYGFALAAGDFNHDNLADLAVGAPSEEVGNAADAGAVSVLYGSAGGLSSTGGRLFTQVGSDPNYFEGFGGALAAGDFNQDGFADLAVGASGQDVGSSESAGTVSVLPGSAGGLTIAGGRLFTQVGGASEPGDLFGWTLAAGDVNHDGYADLAAGAPFEDVGAVADAGAVSVLPGSAGGLTTSGGRLFTQDTSGIPGAAEPGDQFAGALTSSDMSA